VLRELKDAGSSVDLIEFIEQTSKAETVGQLFSLLENVMENYGFDRVLFSLMTDHASIGKPSGHGIMRNYPGEWMAYYADRKYEDADPVRQYVVQAPAPFTWSFLEDHLQLMPDQQKVMDEAREAGLYHGIAIPMRGPMGAIAGIGAASSAAGGSDISRDTLALVNAACQQFYASFIGLEQKTVPSAQEGVSLTEREKEVLKWCAQGKTTWEIGVILGLSEAGVLFHLRNVMKKFNTSSRVYAVMQAVRFGLIQL